MTKSSRRDSLIAGEPATIPLRSRSVRERNWPTLLGNHEAAVVNPQIAEGYNPAARLCIYYTMGAVDKADRAWMRSLPIRLL